MSVRGFFHYDLRIHPANLLISMGQTFKLNLVVSKWSIGNAVIEGYIAINQSKVFLIAETIVIWVDSSRSGYMGRLITRFATASATGKLPSG